MKEIIPQHEKTICDVCGEFVIDHDEQTPPDYQYKKITLDYISFIRKLDICPSCWPAIVKSVEKKCIWGNK